MFYNRKNVHAKQRGIALLTAMLIVSVASVIMVSLSHEQSFTIRKTSRLQSLDRARVFSLGMESWAQIFLHKDRVDNAIDHLGEGWANGMPGLVVEGWQVYGEFTDSQAKININNLNSAPGVTNQTLNRFIRLCENLKVETAFIPALQDWLDDDINVRFPNGAEDDYYASLEDPYRSANRLMVDISELRLVSGIDVEMYQKLLPFITVLPTTTALNINTISGELYSSLGNKLDEERFIEEREKGEFQNMADFITRMTININTNELDVSTEHFLATGTVTQGDLVLTMSSLIHRDSTGKTTVLSRRLSDF